MNTTLKWILAFVVVEQIALGWSPSADRLTWMLENAPVWIGVVAIALTWKRFPLSNLCLILLAVHSLILAVGGHYTYAKVPLGNWVRDALDLSRNHYDRMGHVAQGFIPAILVREVLMRQLGLRGAPAAALSIACCLAFSAFYELIEWWVAVFTEEGASAFLGTQGDTWDTQWDMFLALSGATAAVLLLPKWHDRSIARLAEPWNAPRH